MLSATSFYSTPRAGWLFVLLNDNTNTDTGGNVLKELRLHTFSGSSCSSSFLPHDHDRSDTAPH
ncbi:hypothetical protein KSP40_PGU003794 [Platanthera guangdongensis]|uniref:Uncharacterized protein n=1 Tax=Platanthera guangdongensis TaxID=2320717 RepID=A0ABR2MG03_9ASPA